ncbi:hypothetical protein [Agaribacter flavus]|uniref:Uncharacterized protein n=1 Tax=Agaribacter flavus TaxID=1902781 RepID=A0ABV7FS10_9ALTE
MKTFKKSSAVLATSTLLALAGCGGGTADDFTPAPVQNDSPPVHGGDIAMEFQEKDTITFVELLGTPEGRLSGEGNATDADGNFLTVTDVTITTSGPRADEIQTAGIELRGNKLGVRPLDIAPNLDTDETHTVVVNFNISDGANLTPRTATITIVGEDFAPEIANDLVGNFTRDAGASSIDGLLNVSDADGEPLTISNLVASTDNPFELPISINGTNIDVDIAAVESQIPDGQRVTFNYTYTVSDHRFDIERNLTVNVLGVQDVPGAPLVLNYFKSLEVDETDAVMTIDLSDEIQEREGDDIVILDVMADGGDLPYGLNLDGNILEFNPHAFFNAVPAGSFVEKVISYNVEDSNGNRADGTAELTIRINGVQTNLMATALTDPTFEDPSIRGPLVTGGNLAGFNEFGFFSSGCNLIEVTNEAAIFGDYGLKIEGANCELNGGPVIDVLEANKKYAFSMALKNTAEVSGNPWISFWNTPGADTFWAGARYFDNTTINTPLEHVFLLSTFEGGSHAVNVGLSLSFNLAKFFQGFDIHFVDDFHFVEYGFIDLAAHDILTNDVGLFDGEDPLSSVTNVGGTVAVVESGDSMVLEVNTTGSESVTVSLPIDAGAIIEGGRYLLSADVNLTNKEEGADNETFSASLSNGTSAIGSGTFGTAVASATTTSEIFFSEKFDTSDIDWSSETVTVNLTFNGVDSIYHIDNVRLVFIPE